MFTYYQKDTRTENERSLQDELDRERERVSDMERREDERREAKNRERKENYAAQMRTADDWPEAFQKQAQLCWHEHNMYPEQNDDETFFQDTALANEKALEIWNRIAKEKQAQINAILASLRDEVATELETDKRREFKTTAQQIRNNELDGYLDW